MSPVPAGSAHSFIHSSFPKLPLSSRKSPLLQLHTETSECRNPNRPRAQQTQSGTQTLGRTSCTSCPAQNWGCVKGRTSSFQQPLSLHPQHAHLLFLHLAVPIPTQGCRAVQLVAATIPATQLQSHSSCTRSAAHTRCSFCFRLRLSVPSMPAAFCPCPPSEAHAGPWQPQVDVI